MPRPKINLFNKASAAPAKIKPLSLSDLPQDIAIEIRRINGLWQCMLICGVLHVVIGYSDYEPTYDLAIEEALSKYAIIKRIPQD